jgi:hypothetical protein
MSIITIQRESCKKVGDQQCKLWKCAAKEAKQQKELKSLLLLVAHHWWL